jgi:hypothetical protein
MQDAVEQVELRVLVAGVLVLRAVWQLRDPLQAIEWL